MIPWKIVCDKDSDYEVSSLPGLNGGVASHLTPAEAGAYFLTSLRDFLGLTARPYPPFFVQNQVLRVSLIQRVAILLSILLLRKKTLK